MFEAYVGDASRATVVYIQRGNVARRANGNDCCLAYLPVSFIWQCVSNMHTTEKIMRVCLTYLYKAREALNGLLWGGINLEQSLK